MEDSDFNIAFTGFEPPEMISYLMRFTVKKSRKRNLMLKKN